MTGKRPDDWPVDQLEEMAKMAENLAVNLADVVKSMKSAKIDALALQARKKRIALTELVSWARFDLAKALTKQSEMRAKGSLLAESSRKARRK